MLVNVFDCYIVVGNGVGWGRGLGDWGSGRGSARTLMPNASYRSHEKKVCLEVGTWEREESIRLLRGSCLRRSIKRWKE